VIPAGCATHKPLNASQENVARAKEVRMTEFPLDIGRRAASWRRAFGMSKPLAARHYLANVGVRDIWLARLCHFDKEPSSFGSDFNRRVARYPASIPREQELYVSDKRRCVFNQRTLLVQPSNVATR
jgi:hypothetical protein